MKRIAIALLVVVAVAAGAAVYLVLRGSPSGAAGTSAQQASQAFFADRGGGTPGPSIMTFGTGGGQVPGVVGEITAIDGEHLTVKNPMDGTTTTVHLAANTPVQTQAAGTLADLTAGTPILASGPQTGDTVNAQQIQIRGTDAITGPVMIGNGGPGTGTPGAGPAGDQVFTGAVPAPANGTPAPGGAPDGPIFIGGTPGADGALAPATVGTITAVAGSTLTVQAADGTTVTVQVGSGTAIRKPATVTPSAVRVGDTVAAQGTAQGAVFEATSLQVLRAAAVP